jgi:hypothetical protein
MADAFGTTFIWVLGFIVVALFPTLALIRFERRAPRDAIPEPEAKELAWESV